MDSTMKCDFSNQEDVLRFVSDYFEVSEIDIINFLRCNKEFRTNLYLDFIKEFNIEEHKLNSENVLLKAKHVTTVIDGEKSIDKYGFINLIDVLEKDTPIKLFLNEQGIQLNIKNKTIKIDGRVYEIDENDDEEHLHNKLYCHKGEREVFLGNIQRNYSSVELYPEILHTIEKFCNRKIGKSKDLCNDWVKKNKKSCALEFYVSLNYLNTVETLGYFKDDYYELWGLNYFEEQVPKRCWDNLYLFNKCISILYNRESIIFGVISNDACIEDNDIFVNYNYKTVI